MMGRHSVISTNKVTGAALLGAVASGLAAALSGAATATATCASIDGMDNGNGAFALASGTSNTVQALGHGSLATASDSTAPQTPAGSLLSLGAPAGFLANAPGLFGTGSNNIATAQGTNQIGVAFGDNHIAINGTNNIK